MSTFFFTINFGLAVLFLAGCTYCIGAMESPGSFLGGVAFFAPAAAFATAEWIGWYHARIDVVRVLAVLCLVLGGFFVFGVVANAAEALQSGWPAGFEWFVVIGLGLASYFICCGIFRLRSIKASNLRL